MKFIVSKHLNISILLAYIVLATIIIITITLFPEDNIFGTNGTNASLTYGPQIQKHTCV